MFIQNKVIGLLALDARTPGRFNENHARLVAAFADQVAIALENVRLYQRALSSADRLGALYETGQEIAASLVPDDVYEAIRRAVSRLMPADIVLIGWFDSERRRYETLYMATQLHQRVRNNEPVEQGSLIKRLVKGQAVRISRLEPHPTSSLRLHPASQTGPLIQSLLAVPLRLGGQVVGVLATHAQKEDAYTPDDQRVLELLAAQAAIALDNSRMFREAQQMAYTDPLTRLFNRRQFFQVGRTEFERSTRYDRPLSLLMIDIDHFKQTNDEYGHNIGDQVLANLADILSSALRKVDIVARYGGEEFVILLPETNSEAAREVAERLRMRVELSPIPTDKGPLHITVSVGVGVCTSKCVQGALSLVRDEAKGIPLEVTSLTSTS
jgi:diguanylate cyclase (GGDEF)-like protein